eukprot:Skav210760  [mRNA]  locus=scaffold1132:60851:62484:- [translate_table: standard]
METYAEITGDLDGVEITTDENQTRHVKGRCWSNYFWYPPACRDEPARCVIFFTGGNGWSMENTMQKSAAWNMPLAPAVAKTWSLFSQLPKETRSTFYWWVPDPTFLHLNPMEITFPPSDRTALVSGDQRGASEALSVDKYVSQDQWCRWFHGSSCVVGGSMVPVVG